VFANTEEEAVAVADPLRTALWTEHQLSVLLPSGAEPIKALHSFRDNKTTLLVCTAAASRGLDLPAVSHVYNLDAPSSAEEYLHRAGRAGRIGSTTGGIVTTLVAEEQLGQVQQIAEQLGLQLAEVPAKALEESDDVEDLRKGLEDIFTFY
jgi:superfamily II DNA/RNA helicase